MVLSLAWSMSDVIEAETADYEVILEFSRVLRLFDLYSQEYTETEKLFMTIEMFVMTPIDEIPEEDFPIILDELTKRIIGDEPLEPNAEIDIQGNILEKEKKFYDFEEDSPYIYSSFMKDYSIDLENEREKSIYYWEKFQEGEIDLEEFRKSTMSWDKFCALLIGLSEDTKFRRVIELRQMKIPENATDEERENIRKAKNAVALKSDREQIEFEMMDLKQQREFMMRKEADNYGK